MVDKTAYKFLAQLIVRIRPEAADAVFPHGPIGALGAAVERREHGSQPQPTREVAVIAAADAHLAEIIALTRTAEGVGGETGKNLVRLALSKVADFDELCPRWPKWPIGWPPIGHWPPPPPPPWWWRRRRSSPRASSSSPGRECWRPPTRCGTPASARRSRTPGGR